MPGKERKRKRGIETAAHNCVEIEGSLYVITHITGFRLGHKWNRTTMGDNTVTGLVTIPVLKVLLWPMRIFIAFPGRPDITSDLQNPGVPPAD